MPNPTKLRMKNLKIAACLATVSMVLAMDAAASLNEQGNIHESPEGAGGDFPHHAASVTFDEQLTLSALVESTMERHPQAVVLQAGQKSVEAEQKYGRRWFPDVAELSGFHMSDQQFDDIGAYENEAGLSVPLWLPGEKKAHSELGEAMSVTQTSRDREFRWYVSGLLRRQLWQLMVSRRDWELAKEQEQRLADLLEQVSLFTDVGDTSRADLLDTMQELAIWKAETMTLEAEYQDAAREYNALTGSFVVPASTLEPLSETRELDENHPVLQRALDQYSESSAATEVAGQENTARPSVNVFWRNFRGDRNAPGVDALGLGFSLPLGKSPARGPEIARAHEELARAEAQLLQIRRDLDLQLHEAQHQAHVTEQKLENSHAMMKAATEKYELDKLSFELGEISVRQWLRRLSEYKDIERSHELLLLQKGAAVAAYNQAVGESL